MSRRIGAGRRERGLDQAVRARTERLGKRLGDVHGLDREAVSGVAGERLQRGHEAELGQRRGPQLAGQLPHVVEHADDLRVELVERSIGRAQVLAAEHPQAEQHRRERLRELLVQGLRHTPAIVLLIVEQPAEPSSAARAARRGPSAARSRAPPPRALARAAAASAASPAWRASSSSAPRSSTSSGARWATTISPRCAAGRRSRLRPRAGHPPRGRRGRAGEPDLGAPDARGSHGCRGDRSRELLAHGDRPQGERRVEQALFPRMRAPHAVAANRPATAAAARGCNSRSRPRRSRRSAQRPPRPVANPPASPSFERGQHDGQDDQGAENGVAHRLHGDEDGEPAGAPPRPGSPGGARAIGGPAEWGQATSGRVWRSQNTSLIGGGLPHVSARSGPHQRDSARPRSRRARS